ncbi:GTPase IMAP family member 7 [Thunnus albacares]|uniref:GTPase IMAP family member 7 n=1 Tax=Thunnus albacares TaxID=8236 RepID=UPI001CF68C6A|nr:GTPase IMAP family member 7 [Thunnus albacares]
MGSWSPPGNVDSSELKIFLVGPRRTGKSSAGNTLLSQGQVFETRGGGASTAAGAITSGRHLTVVDAQGWGSSEDFVPREEKIELLRALSLCEPGGPHVVLLVIPLLDFTEPERRAVERRMEILTSAVWRHTMVLFTFGDLLRGRGKSVQEHIQSGGCALRWLMEKCHYRYYVMDNKTTIISEKETLKQEVNGGVRKQGKTWWKKDAKEAGRKCTGSEADRKKEAEQEQVRELLSKVEDMLQENGGWHFSLHMYQRLEEEWSRREQELRARLEAETGVGRVRTKQEMEVKMEPEKEQRLKT